MKLLRESLVLFVLLTLVTGVAYPLLVTGVAQVAMPYQANGSMITAEHASDRSRSMGSELIGQPFSSPRYFWSRPSSTGPMPYKSASSSGSNLGPTNPAQLAAVRERVAAIRRAQGDAQTPVPIDLVTASASGLDPHISQAAAAFQAARVARERGLTQDRIRQIVAEHTEGRTFGILGEPRVNVLQLNLALDRVE
jgi:potassium-transporting ATPase KdpC subunit